MPAGKRHRLKKKKKKWWVRSNHSHKKQFLNETRGAPVEGELTASRERTCGPPSRFPSVQGEDDKQLTLGRRSECPGSGPPCCWPIAFSWVINPPNCGFHDGIAGLFVPASFFFTLRVKKGEIYPILLWIKWSLREVKLSPQPPPLAIQGKWPSIPSRGLHNPVLLLLRSVFHSEGEDV